MHTKAMRQLIDANLPPATERVALRLLDLAHPDNGQLNITQPGLCTLTRCETLSGARKHLTTLQSAGIIHYSTNHHVYITFSAWTPQDGAPMPENRAPMPQPSPTPTHPMPENRAPTPQNGAPMPQNGASPHTRTLEVEDPLHNPRDTDLLPLKGTSDAWKLSLVPLPPELHFDVAAIGILPHSLRIHPNLTIPEARAIIHTWRAEATVGAVGAGALVYRLRHGWTNAPPNRRFVPPTKNYFPDEYSDVILGKPTTQEPDK